MTRVDDARDSQWRIHSKLGKIDHSTNYSNSKTVTINITRNMLGVSIEVHMKNNNEVCDIEFEHRRTRNSTTQLLQGKNGRQGQVYTFSASDSLGGPRESSSHTAR